MPKETSIGRQNAHHQPLTSQAYTSTQPTSAFLHQYNHLPRPPGGYPFFPAGYEANVASMANAYEQANAAKGRQFAAIVSAANASPYAYKMPTVYDRRPQSPQQPALNAHQVSQQHQTYERNSGHVLAPQFSPSDPKLAQFIASVQYDRFSKKKLASHGPEKSAPMYARNEPSRPPSTTRQTTTRDRSPLKATTSSATTSRSSSGTTSSKMSSPMAADDKYRQERHKYDSARGDYYRRSGSHRRESERSEANFERSTYEPPPTSVYDRLGVPPPTVITSSATTFDRNASAAYERRAVFDRAYEQAAYERRAYGAHFPSAVNTSSAYYSSYPRNSGSQQNSEELLMVESKDMHSNFPAKPRMSLLTSAEYLSSVSRRSHADETRSGQTSVIVPSPARAHAEPPSPTKVSKLRDVKPETMQPLTIDTSVSIAPPKVGDDKPSIYQPTVEPISPTSPPGADGAEDSTTSRGLSKERLLSEISHVDRKINKIEVHLAHLKRREVELKEKAIKTETNVSDDTAEAPLPKHFSVAHKVYSENRKKAREAHSAMNCLGPSVQLPLYNQPSDTLVYHENVVRHHYFKHILIRNLAGKRNERASRDRRLTEEYSKKTEIWNRAVEKMENSPDRKRRDAEHRELFEKIFPKIRKEREDRERFLRVGSRVKSDADLEEIMDNLHEQEMETKKMRAYAAVPPLLLPQEARRCVYVNTNGRVEDFATVHKERSLINIWTDSEKEIFREKYLQYPKNFGVIASFLERKSVCDCVQYYYLSKKTESYKRLLKKTGHRARAGRNRNKTSQQAPEAQPVPAPSTPAIAPRFQRDYKPDTAPAPAPPVVMETSPRTPSPAPQPPPLSPTPPTVAPDWTTDDKEPPLEPPQLPPLLQPLLLPSDELPRSDRREHIVVIEDSDDSNSGTPFLKK